ncbi:hypothetical protein [Pedobacter sp.]|uniref:hypothetical protein n=1 Tax=Pedobacter sp. TaxID=1411316 RepID=UPI003BA87993
MKKILVLFVFSPFWLFSQQKPNKLAVIKATALKTLKQNLNNPSSYTGVSWGDLKIQNTSINDSEKKYQTLLIAFSSQKKYLAKQIDDEMNKRNLSEFGLKADEALISSKESELKKVTNSLDSIIKKREIDIQGFKPQFKNYYIEHKFRTRNNFNALILVNYFFIFSEELQLMEYGILSY